MVGNMWEHGSICSFKAMCSNSLHWINVKAFECSYLVTLSSTQRCNICDCSFFHIVIAPHGTTPTFVRAWQGGIQGNLPFPLASLSPSSYAILLLQLKIWTIHPQKPLQFCCAGLLQRSSIYIGLAKMLQKT